MAIPPLPPSPPPPLPPLSPSPSFSRPVPTGRESGGRWGGAEAHAADAGGVGLAGDAALADATSGQCDDAQGAVGVGQEDDGLDRSSGGRADGVCWAREERAVHVLSGDIGHEIFGGEHIWKSALSMCNHRRIRLDD